MENVLKQGDMVVMEKFSEIRRFDIVVFPFQGSDVFYIKRIIGLPGETIRIDEDGNIYVNGEILEEDYGYETIVPAMIGRAGEEIKLGEDEYFLMGDNCNNSEDSRYVNIGNISKKEINGKVVFRISPRSEIGMIK